MASTYSTNLGTNLMASGDQSGTWGGTTNFNLGTLMEQAISAYVTQQFSSADVTLLLVQGSDAGSNTTAGTIYSAGTVAVPVSARNMYIECQGTTSGGGNNLIVPNNTKLYFVYNNTTGGSITVKTSAGSGIAVPVGQRAILVCNGSSVVSATTYSATFASPSAVLTGGTIDSITVGATTASTVRGTIVTATSQFTGPGTGLTGTAASFNIGGNAATATLATTATNLSGGSVAATTITASGSTVLGTATGGSQGSGTLNAQGVYVNGSSVITSAVTSVATSSTPNNGLYISGGTITTTGTLSLAGTLSGVSLTTQVSGTLPVANGGTGVTTSTGSGNNVLSTSPTLVTPILGTPTSGNLANCTFPTLNQSTTGNAATATTATNLSGGTVSATTIAGNSLAVGSPTGGNLGAGTINAQAIYVNNVAVGVGNGSVSSVGMSVPSFLSVTPASITSTGTFAVSYSGTALPVANGGTGATTLTGYVYGNGTGAFTASTTIPGSAISGNITGNAATATTATTAGNVSGTVAIGNGGTGQTTAANALNALLPTQTGNVGYALTTNGSTPSWSAVGTGSVTSIIASTTPVNGLSLSGGTISTSGTIAITGTLSGVALGSAVTGTLPLGNGGTGQTTAQAAMNALAGGVTSGAFLRGNGTNVVLAALVSGDIPNNAANTTGTAGNVTGTVAVANGGTGATSAGAALTNLGAYAASNPSGYTSNTGTVTSVATTGTVNGITLTGGTITTSGTITLGGTLSGVNLTSQVTGTLPVANGGTGTTTSTGSGNVVLASSPAISNANLTTPVLGTPSSGNLSNCTVDGTNAVGFLGLPQNSQGAYTLATSDRGKCVIATGAISVPNATFSAGDVVTIFNNTASGLTISNSLSTLYQAGTANTGSKTLAQRGLATIYFISSTVGVISGTGLS